MQRGIRIENTFLPFKAHSLCGKVKLIQETFLKHMEDIIGFEMYSPSKLLNIKKLFENLE
jgi:hypothetical protein